MRRRGRTVAIFAAAATFAAMLVLCRPLIEDYFPIHDDLALEATATPLGGPVRPQTWFTDGYHAFFRSFPEWGWEDANFLRPLAQALYWLHYQLAGTHFASQLVVGYAAHAIAVGLVAWLALGVLELAPGYAAVAVLIAALNPALWTPFLGQYAIAPLLQLPVYQTEIACAVLMLVATLAFASGRYRRFGLIVTVALMLKETAITAPISALLLAGAWRGPDRRTTLRNAGWLLLPLAVWLAIKLFVFRYGFSSYQTTSSRPFELWFEPLRNLLLWPSGLYEGPLAATRAALAGRDAATLAAHAGALAVNAMWWLAIAGAIAAAVRATAGSAAIASVGRRWLAQRPQPWLVALVFALGNLGLVVVLVATQLRFGYFWFALGPAALFAAWTRLPSPVARRIGAGLAAALCAGVVLVQPFVIARTFAPDSIADYRLVRQSARQLAALLGGLPPEVTTAFLMDDLVVQVPGPEYLAAVSGFRGRLILVNLVRPVRGCVRPGHDQPERRYDLRLEGSGEAVLEYRAPACFEPPWNVATVDQFDGNELRRGDTMTYIYPDLVVPRASGPRAFDVGDRWTVAFRDPACQVGGACVWIGLAPDSRRYFLINKVNP